MNQIKSSKICSYIVKKLSKNLSIEEITVYLAQNNQKELEEMKFYKSKNRLQASETQLYDQSLEELNSQKHRIKSKNYEMMLNFLEGLQPIYKIGDSMQKIVHLEKIILGEDNQTEIQENATLEIEGGIVYIISLWDNIIKENEGPLDEVQQLYQIKTEWKNKVKLISISLKSQSKKMIEIINQKKWKCFEHYRIQKYGKVPNKFLSMLNYEDLPYVVIIGKNGKIVHIGFHFEVVLEDIITQELQKEEEITPQQQEINNNNLEKSQLYQQIINEIQQDKQDQNIQIIQQSISNENQDVQVSQLQDQQSEVDQDNKDKQLSAEKQIPDQQKISKQENNKKDVQQENAQKMIKEQLKVQKQQLKDIQEILKSFNFEGNLSISLIRTRKLEKANKFKIEQISEFELSYSVSNNDLDQLESFIDQVWNQIPEPLRRIKQSDVYNQSVNLVDIQKKIRIIFKNSGKIRYPETINIVIIWDRDLEKMVISEKKGFTVSISELSLAQFYEGIQESNLHFSQLNENENYSYIINKLINQIRLSVTLGPGKKFVPILNYKKYGADEKSQINHEQGQVLVIFYWTCNNDCINLLKNLEQILLKNNESWGKNVNFVALNTGEEKEYQQFMEQNEQFKNVMNIYHKKEIVLGDTYLYGATHVPYFVIVDKLGVIRQINIPLNIENSINKVVKEGNVQYPQIFKIQRQSVNLIKKKIGNQDIKKQLSSFDKDRIIDLRLEFEAQQIGKDLEFQKAYLNYFIRDKQEEEFNKLLIQLFQVIPEHCWNINKQISKTISIKYPGNICAVCQQDISSEPKQYYCYFKNEYVCVQCAEFTDLSKKGMDIYKYQDTLIFINGPLQDESVLQDIDSHKIGKNRKLKEGEDDSLKFNFICNGCNNSQHEGPRYIAVNARPGKYRGTGYLDYCQQCFQVLKNKDSIEAKKIIEKDVAEGMNSDNLFTRVLFWYGKYSEF